MPPRRAPLRPRTRPRRPTPSHYEREGGASAVHGERGGKARCSLTLTHLLRLTQRVATTIRPDCSPFWTNGEQGRAKFDPLFPAAEACPAKYSGASGQQTHCTRGLRNCRQHNVVAIAAHVADPEVLIAGQEH